MANFPPLKARLLQALDDAIARHGIRGPFLDFGAGRGDVAAHLASRHGFTGVLVESQAACRAAYPATPAIAGFRACAALDDAPPLDYSLALAFDVLEHLEDPGGTIRDLRARLVTGGVLVAVVPYRPRAWGWDDVFYGHLRRWSRREFEDLLRASGFVVERAIDPTFPVYSLMRRLMLLRYRRPPVPAAAHAATQCSAMQNAWGEVPGWARCKCWGPINRLGRLTERIFLGDELFVVARAGPALRA